MDNLLRYKKIKIYLREFLYILKTWIVYIRFKFVQPKVKGYLYETFKNSENYTKIIYNEIYKLSTNHYKFNHKILFKFVQKPYKFFQKFSSKVFNYNLTKESKFFPHNTKIKISNIKPFTYYEGIDFNNIIFSSFNLEHICFHNCTFNNCIFDNVTSKIDFSPIQGFSACDFINTVFRNCSLNCMFFSMGNFNHIEFTNSNLNMCLFHRINFENTIFSGNITLNNTNIYNPSLNFNISFLGSIENIHIDSRCCVSAFSYNDIINYNIENFFIYKIRKRSIYSEVANTYFALDQIWAFNHIREQDKNYTNFYYQRKKAETRSCSKLSKLHGYFFEFVIGYGENPFRAFVSMSLIILLFSFIFLFTGFKPDSNSPEIIYSIGSNSKFSLQCVYDWYQSFNFSFITMITVGQGDPSPSTLLTQIAMSIELLMGAISMTLFTSTLFRKYTK